MKFATRQVVTGFSLFRNDAEPLPQSVPVDVKLCGVLVCRMSLFPAQYSPLFFLERPAPVCGFLCGGTPIVVCPGQDFEVLITDPYVAPRLRVEVSNREF